MQKKGKMMRYIGIVCWFLALFFLLQSAQEKRLAKEEAEQNPIVSEIETETEPNSTILYPSAD